MSWEKKKLHKKLKLYMFLSKWYIHRYWTGPQILASLPKCMAKWAITSETFGRRGWGGGGQIVPNLHKVVAIFFCNASKSSVLCFSEHNSLYKLHDSITLEHTHFTGKESRKVTRRNCITMWQSCDFNCVLLRYCKFIHRDILDEYPSKTFKSCKPYPSP